jgi:hypothetical protein
MSFFHQDASQQSVCTTNISRPGGGISGFRHVHNRASRVAVWVFPMTRVADIVLAKAAMPAAYILADHQTAYLGETNHFGSRLTRHRGDPTKQFAREAFVITGYPEPWSNKDPAIYLQYHLMEIAEETGHVNIANTQSAQTPVVPDNERGVLERILGDTRLLLHDAGCRVLDSNFDSLRRTGPSEPREGAIGSNDEMPMRIDVIASPPLGSELELDYTGLWARGYPAANGGFVVMAGSEVRSVVNASANPIVTTRRKELADAEVLAPIPGLQDRLRLRVSVWFPSAAIAAKVVTGAHVNSRVWGRPSYPQPLLITTT